jgi:UPF0755 protein
MLKLVRWSIALLSVAGIACGITIASAWRMLNEPINVSEESIVVDIVPGSTLTRLTRQLNADGVLDAPRILDWYARLSGVATRVQAGEYRLTSELTPLTLLEMLSNGDVVMHQLTVVEGWRFDQFVAVLRGHPAIVAGSESNEAIMRALNREGLHPEGQFLPDTYVFPKGTRDVEVLRQAHAALELALDAAWQQATPSAVLQSPYEALILASIIEKETALAAERALIAGVFHERLKIGMRLETDPTVIYGLGANYDGNLRRRDMAADTPYNTYTRHGLPPTPIALPGRAAILAAVQPDISGALYFVATGAGDGGHQFSRTYEEHRQAVREYLNNQRRQPE